MGFGFSREKFPRLLALLIERGACAGTDSRLREKFWNASRAQPERNIFADHSQARTRRRTLGAFVDTDIDRDCLKTSIPRTAYARRRPQIITLKPRRYGASLVAGNAFRIADASGDSAIDNQRVTAYERSIVGGEKQDTSRHLFRLAHAAEWMEPVHPLADFLGGAEGLRN